MDAQKILTRLAPGVAGFVGGAIPAIILYPLDLVRTRFQASETKLADCAHVRTSAFGGTWRELQCVVRECGWKRLFQGMSPFFAGNTVAWGSYFYLYERMKKLVWLKPNSAMQWTVASIVAGIGSTAITNPMWVVKTRIQLQRKKSSKKLMVKYNGLIDGMWKLARHEGLRGMYAGFVPAVCLVSHGLVQFVAYESMKRTALGLRSVGVEGTKLGLLDHFVIGAVSKTIAVCSTYPYQVVKTRLQDHIRIDSSGKARRKYAGTRDVVRRIWKKEGILGFYKGLAPSIIRLVPSSAFTLVLYESVLRQLKKLCR